jgi:hypothetical protein
MHKYVRPTMAAALLAAAAIPLSATVASAATVPKPTVLPQISGTRVVGDSLTTTTGTWSPKPTKYTYQWLLCRVDGTNCNPIAGLTTRTIKLPASSASLRLRVTVRATDSAGTRAVTSHSTGLIAGPTVTPPPVTPPPVTPLFSDTFSGPNGLITNEYSYWNPDHGDATVSAVWAMTSGSLFEKDGTGWTGTPDGCSTSSPISSPCTASDVFRLNTVEQDFGNVTVSLDLLNNSLGSSSRTPSVDWDGVHVWLRYQSEYNLYYASFNRRDGHIVIKKKCVGGDDNGGTYYELGNGEVSGYPIPFGTWQHLSASVQNTSSGGVTITMWRNGTQLLQATDNGVGCAPITHAGGVGIRGDNDNFQFDNFTVTQN